MTWSVTKAQPIPCLTISRITQWLSTHHTSAATRRRRFSGPSLRAATRIWRWRFSSSHSTRALASGWSRPQTSLSGTQPMVWKPSSVGSTSWRHITPRSAAPDCTMRLTSSISGKSSSSSTKGKCRAKSAKRAPSACSG
ncbi:hypothetical protein ASF26_14795 [Methylobacterium sp. Leaf93]|nr:hypothetical protein ASF26_14795 [Methylobacterium sp. Leaf93]